MRFRSCLLFGSDGGGFRSAQIATAQAASTKPNVVIILADDLGNADLGYRGSDIKTPNIDKLANEGVRLESFYGMPVCTPSRAELMTGRYAMRYGLETLVIFPSHTYGLPTDERTLPQALKDAGYDTAMVGKWHLGHADQKYWPQNRGFDHFYGNLVGEVDYFTKERGGIVDWQRDGKFSERGRLLHHADRQRGGGASSRTTTRRSRCSSMSPRSRRTRPTRRQRKRSTPTRTCRRRAPADLRRDDHRARHASRADRRRAQAEEHARQHAHHFQQRQWRRHERVVRHRGAVTGRTGGERRRWARAEDAGLERGVPRRQRIASRGRRAGSDDLLLADEAEAEDVVDEAARGWWM